jgi:hypothetical protein
MGLALTFVHLPLLTITTIDVETKNDDGGGMNGNREHTYAKSIGNPNLGRIPGADAHHLYPDVQRNGDRVVKKFGALVGTVASN